VAFGKAVSFLAEDNLCSVKVTVHTVWPSPCCCSLFQMFWAIVWF